MAKNDVFPKEYKKLNKAQKEAVDTIDGPVMVVAGPGTGENANSGPANRKYFTEN